MCLGVPGLIVEREPADLPMPSAVVEFAGVRRTVCVACVPEASVGDYVIVHAGLAISRLDTEEAERLLECLRSLGEDEGWQSAPTPPAERDPSP
ncbi:MAG: hydrogenase assembly protein HypC [Isosphaeraceae bacterium]|jgi:hydrogenase expression/formation protein HypC|nr:MAG: hydrogenase assembly protein HypC [Isosphaeraceae bacterium]